MLEDTLTALALLLAGAIALVISGRGATARRRIDQVLTTTRSLLDVESWQRKWRNPLLRLFFLLLLLIVAGWGAILSQVGVEATQKAVSFRNPTSPDVVTCYRVQQIGVQTLEGCPNIKPGPLDPMIGYACPSGGTYFLDKSGVLTCTRHGSAPDNPPLLAPPLEKKSR